MAGWASGPEPASSARASGCASGCAWAGKAGEFGGFPDPSGGLRLGLRPTGRPACRLFFSGPLHVRVLFLLASSPERNGRFLKMRATLAAAGHTVGAAFTPGGRRPRGLLGTAPSRALAVRISERRLEVQAQAFRPDIVHVMNFALLRAGSAIARRRAARLVYDAAEAWDATPYSDPAVQRYVGAVEARWGAHADAVLTVSPGLVARFARLRPALAPAVLIRNAADPGGPPDDGRLHALAGLPPSQKVLLFQGGLTRDRGLETLIGAAGRLPTDWTLVVLGWGELEAPLRAAALAAEQRHRGRVTPVRVIEPVAFDDLPAYTAGAAAGLIPYRGTCDNHRYCLPNKVFEYAAQGVPVIASDLDELGPVVRGNAIGWTLPDPVTPEALARLLERLDEPALAGAGQAGIAFARQNSWQQEGARLLDVYRDVLARRPQPRSAK